jgi:drug/metabolite transporter (DMT)-like permease
VAYSLFLLICAVWGSSFILMERASHSFGPVAIGIGRLLGGIAVLAVVWWLGRHTYRVTTDDLRKMSLATMFGTAIPFVVVPYVVAQGFGHSYMGMVMAVMPLATMLYSIPMLRIWPTRRQLIGVIVGFICLGFFLQDGSERGMSLGLLALVASVPLMYSFGNTYVKWKLSHVPALELTTVSLALACVMLVPLQLIVPLRDSLGLAPPSEPQDYRGAATALAVLGLVATGVPVLIFVHLILKQGPLFAGMVTYVVPVLAALWGTYDREKITPQQIAAMIGVLTMVALVQSSAAQQTLRISEDQNPG